jgi:alkylated DNA repair dioxygenase AlkB
LLTETLVPSLQKELFHAPLSLPAGMNYVPDFFSPDEETALLESAKQLPLTEARYKNFTAKRRVASFGFEYDFDSNELAPAPSPPRFLQPLRNKIAFWLDMPEAEFAHALVAEYRPGTALGWHRDAPQFGIVVGISLGGWCRMRFRPFPLRKNKREDVFALELAPRSAYVLRDDARWRWQHSIPPTKALRYSITFRTVRSGASHASGENIQ